MAEPAPSPDLALIEQAAGILRAGGLVAMPTETVYGLAADASNPEAVARLYESKGRPRFNPLIAHVRDVEMARREAVVSPLAGRLMAAFWPGPLTIVLPVAPAGTVCDLARAGLETVALRCPAHEWARALILAFGGPVVAPSANRSGHVSPTLAAHVAADLAGKVGLILDAGPCPVGIESTIVAVHGEIVTLLRSGAVPAGAIEAVIGGKLARESGGGISAPGMLKSHYAPKARLRLNVPAPEAGEGFLGFGPGAADMNLSPAGDLAEAAANLFAMLRAMDTQFDRIAVAPVPAEGLGEAINDRLARAAHRDS
ncbi:L-threonylcarbamoyladenylate synthase [Hyphomonas sp.]|uniref:L-threonylcarbamoyladenylate synthase n=1 Tax=Hyphomonas sp. TaxID=87 RepID=UPI00391B56FE